MQRGCFFRGARARNTHVEATLNISCPAQAAVVAATLAALCVFVRKAAAALLFRGRATTWRGLAAELRDEVAARRKPPD